jgi:hypothetical protein
MKVLIETQYKEWYGCEDNVGVEGHGRYKNKGGMDFVISVDEVTFMYDRDSIVEAFNKKYNVEGSWNLCEVLGLSYYREPEEITLDIIKQN